MHFFRIVIPNKRYSRFPRNFVFWLYFYNVPVKTLLQSEFYTFPEFLSVCGGLFGLFLGVSALSIIEFAYHFTLRLFWTIYHRNTNRIEPSSEQETDPQDESQKRTLSQVSTHNIQCDLLYSITWYLWSLRHWWHYLRNSVQWQQSQVFGILPNDDVIGPKGSVFIIICILYLLY